MPSSHFSPRTDLALEAREILQSEQESAQVPLDGIEMTTRQTAHATVTWVRVTNANGCRQLGKPLGSYVTIESDALKENEPEAHAELMRVLADQLGELHKLPEDGKALVVGLGNWRVTPDALGPKVVSQVLVTRHLQGYLPEELAGKVRQVSALSPGVMGLTGMESGEIIKGVAARVQPDLIIAVDALAARRTSRINTTIQISNAGVNPGAGMGNFRMPLNKETLGVPVLAIGVPTVVDAATLVNDAMEGLLDQMLAASGQNSPFYEMLLELSGEDRYGLINELLSADAGNMFVTPKEVDAVIDRLAAVIANGLNIALHPGIGKEDIDRYRNA